MVATLVTYAFKMCCYRIYNQLSPRSFCTSSARIFKRHDCTNVCELKWQFHEVGGKHRWYLKWSAVSNALSQQIYTASVVSLKESPFHDTEAANCSQLVHSVTHCINYANFCQFIIWSGDGDEGCCSAAYTSFPVGGSSLAPVPLDSGAKVCE